MIPTDKHYNLKQMSEDEKKMVDSIRDEHIEKIVAMVEIAGSGLFEGIKDDLKAQNDIPIEFMKQLTALCMAMFTAGYMEAFSKKKDTTTN